MRGRPEIRIFHGLVWKGVGCEFPFPSRSGPTRPDPARPDPTGHFDHRRSALKTADLGPSVLAPPGVPGRSRALLGAPWRSPGAPGRSWGAPGALLGRSRVSHRALLGRSWALQGAPGRSGALLGVPGRLRAPRITREVSMLSAPRHLGALLGDPGHSWALPSQVRAPLTPIRKCGVYCIHMYIRMHKYQRVHARIYKQYMVISCHIYHIR